MAIRRIKYGSDVAPFHIDSWSSCGRGGGVIFLHGSEIAYEQKMMVESRRSMTNSPWGTREGFPKMSFGG